MLTKLDRQAIKDAIIEHKFKPIEATLLAEEYRLAEAFRAHLHGTHLAAMEAFPRGAFPSADCIRANIDGRHIRMSFGSSWEVRRPMFSKFMFFGNALAGSDPLGADILKWEDAREKFRKERDALEFEIAATLNSFRTRKALQKGWPSSLPALTETGGDKS